MAVTFDAVGPAGGGGANSSVSPLTWLHVNAGNAILVGITTFSGTTNNITAVTYGGVALTFLGYVASAGVGGGGVAHYGLVSGTLPTGSNTVSVSFSVAESHNGGSISVSGAGSLGTPVTGVSSGNTLSLSINVTGTTSGGMIVSTACHGASDTYTATGSPNTQTSRYARTNTGNSGSDNIMGGTAPSPGGTQAIGWSATLSDEWGIIAVEVLPPAVIVPPLPSPPLAIPPGLFFPGRALNAQPQPSDPSLVPPPPFPGGREFIPAQTPLIVPPFLTPASWSQPWVPCTDPGVVPPGTPSQYRFLLALASQAGGAAPTPTPGFLDQAGYRPRSAPRLPRGRFFPSLPQGNQGVPFPLFLQQAQRKRLVLRRSEGQFFTPGQFNQVAPQLPSFPRQASAARRITRTVRPARGQFFNQSWNQGNRGAAFPLYQRQAGITSRWALRRSHGTFFSQEWSQGNQGAQLPLYTRNAGSRRIALRRSPGRFYPVPGTTPALPPAQFITREQRPAPARIPRGRYQLPGLGQGNQGIVFPLWERQAQGTQRLVACARKTHGTFFNQAWGQAEQGTRFPLYARQPGNVSRWTLRNPRGRFFGVATPVIAPPPAQFITRQERAVPARIPRGRFQLPGLGQANQGVKFPLWERQPGYSPKWAPRISRGKWFSPGWGQPNQGTAFPLYQRQAGVASRLTLRNPRGRYFGVAVALAAVPPPQFVTRQARPASFRIARGRYQVPGLGQANQGVQYPGFTRQDSRRIVRPPRGKFLLPGQFNLAASRLPQFLRQAQPQRLVLRRAQGRYFTPGQFNLDGNAYPGFTRQAQPQRLTLRRSQGKYFTPGQFNLTANPSLPQFLRQDKPRLVRESHGQYFGLVSTPAPPAVPGWVSPRRPKLSPPRRGRFSGIPKAAIIPVYPPDFRTTRRFNFTRLDKLRRGNVIQLVPFQSPAGNAGAAVLRTGVPHYQWATGDPDAQWKTGTVAGQWATGAPARSQWNYGVPHSEWV